MFSAAEMIAMVSEQFQFVRDFVHTEHQLIHHLDVLHFGVLYRHALGTIASRGAATVQLPPLPPSSKGEPIDLLVEAIVAEIVALATPPTTPYFNSLMEQFLDYLMRQFAEAEADELDTVTSEIEYKLHGIVTLIGRLHVRKLVAASVIKQVVADIIGVLEREASETNKPLCCLCFQDEGTSQEGLMKRLCMCLHGHHLSCVLKQGDRRCPHCLQDYPAEILRQLPAAAPVACLMEDVTGDSDDVADFGEFLHNDYRHHPGFS